MYTKLLCFLGKFLPYPYSPYSNFSLNPLAELSFEVNAFSDGLNINFSRAFVFVPSMSFSWEKPLLSSPPAGPRHRNEAGRGYHHQYCLVQGSRCPTGNLQYQCSIGLGSNEPKKCGKRSPKRFRKLIRNSKTVWGFCLPPGCIPFNSWFSVRKSSVVP